VDNNLKTGSVYLISMSAFEIEIKTLYILN